MQVDPPVKPPFWPCKFLRSKEMYYQDHPKPGEPYGGDNCWCMHTQHQLGPDGKSVHKMECRPGRHCYEQRG